MVLIGTGNTGVLEYWRNMEKYPTLQYSITPISPVRGKQFFKYSKYVSDPSTRFLGRECYEIIF
jgi:hypothetical protein